MDMSNELSLYFALSPSIEVRDCKRSAIIAQLIILQCFPMGPTLPPLKMPLFLRGRSWPPSNTCNHGSLDPPESATQTASRSVQPFLSGHESDQHRDTQTVNHATPYVAIGRCHLYFNT